MLIELSIVLSTYMSFRTIDNLKKKKKVSDKIVKNKLSALSPQKDLMISFLGLGVSVIQPVFFPNLALINAFLLSYSNYPCLKGAERSLKKKKISNDVLGSGWTVFAVVSGQYFAGALGIVVYHLSTNFIEKTRNESKKSLVNIFDINNRKVFALQDGVEIEIPLEDIAVDNLIVVYSGEMIPVDGEIIFGFARIDEHVLTGESQIIEKASGQMVFASTLLVSGSIHIRVKKAGNDTAVAKIEQVLNQTTDFKSNLQLKGEALADKSAPYVLSMAGLTALVAGATPAAAVLSAQFGYQIRMAAPLSTLRHLSQASNSGILVKDGRSLERLCDIDTVLFDKTGTLTEEQPQVGEIISWKKYSTEDILEFAATAEAKLKHPIAKAILQAYLHYKKPLDDIDDIHYEMGFGTKVYLKDKIIRVGSLRYMENEGLFCEEEKQRSLENIYRQGNSIVMIGLNNDVIGAIEIKPTIRPEIPELIKNLKNHGIENLIIVSGDHQKPTKKLAEDLGMTNSFAEVLPEGKFEIVSKLQKRGHKVCFIGDGINDTIAMKQADVAVSLKGASTIAIDTADIVLLNGELRPLNELFEIAQKLNYTMQNSIAMVVMPATLILIGGIWFHISLLTAVLIKQGFLGANIFYILKNSKSDKKSLNAFERNS